MREIFARSILSKSGIGGVDYSINPYLGCSHGCIYCYARLYTERFWKDLAGDLEWGHFIFPKVNAPRLLKKEIRRKKAGLILLSSVTDPYVPQESIYKITRRILGILANGDFFVSILTKSPLVTRDLDILSRLKEAEVGFSISGLDSPVLSRFEPRAPSVKLRLQALRKLSSEGISTYAFISPILPGITESRLESLFKEIKKASPDRIMADLLRIRPGLWNPIKKVVKSFLPHHFQVYNEIRFDLSYFYNLKERFEEVAGKYGYEIEWMY